jgi:hypothetical protein
MRLKDGGKRHRLPVVYFRSSPIAIREEGSKVGCLRKYVSMRILRKYTGFISNFKSVRSLLLTLFVRPARALFCENSIKLGGVGIYGRKDRQIFPIFAKIYSIRARTLRQRKFSEYIIIDSKVGDDHQSSADNPMDHPLSGQWPFDKSQLSSGAPRSKHYMD